MLWTNLITPAELSGYIRAALADQPLNKSLLRQWLPSRLVSDIEWQAERQINGLDKSAQYRSFDAQSRVASRLKTQTFKGELLPISEELRFGEYDIIRKRQDGDIVMRDALINDAVTIAKRIETRFEVARGMALETAALTINENRVISTISFGRRSAATTTVGTVWTNLSTSDPMNDLVAVSDGMTDINGEPPGALLMSVRTKRLLLTNSTIRAQFASIMGQPTRITDAQLGQLLSEYSLPPIYTYDKSVDVNGTATRIISPNKVLFLPAPVGPDAWQDTQLGATVVGETAEATELTGGSLVGNEPGLIATVHKDDRPIAVWTHVAGIGMPVLANPDLSATLTVY